MVLYVREIMGGRERVCWIEVVTFVNIGGLLILCIYIIDFRSAVLVSEIKFALGFVGIIKSGLKFGVKSIFLQPPGSKYTI